jgi:hypothetical protein
MYADIASVASVKGSFGSPLFSALLEGISTCNQKRSIDLLNIRDIFQKT